MAVVLLHDLPRVGIVAQNLAVLCPGHKEVLLVVARMKLDAVGNLLVGEPRDALPRLRVPQPHHLVVAGGEVPRAVVVERNVPHTRSVAMESAEQPPPAIHFPQLDLVVHRAREKEVRRLGEQPHPVHPFGVPRPLEDLPLRQEAPRGGLAQLCLDVGRSVHVRPPKIVLLLSNVENRALGRLDFLGLRLLFGIGLVRVGPPLLECSKLLIRRLNGAGLGEDVGPLVLAIVALSPPLGPEVASSCVRVALVLGRGLTTAYKAVGRLGR
mmetsp:Transcript_29646/g.77764  ORF Transcript_29646/g.77764 Transcript_29646/m.77764 type:complete len:268 (-) Transcript_29646:637-1440(-)